MHDGVAVLGYAHRPGCSLCALVVASPRPEDAPVITTVLFLNIFFHSGDDLVIAGVVVAVWALITAHCSEVNAASCS